MTKFIILDRDGVINRDSAHFIKSPEEWIPIPGSLQAIAKLKEAGFTVSVATNQSGIGRQLFSLEDLNNIHQKMNNAIIEAGGMIDTIFFCPHLPEDNCPCRKPKPGLFEQVAKHYYIDYQKQKIYAIGDSLRDLEAAESAGAYPILVETGNGKKTLGKLPDRFKNIPRYSNLATAVDALMNTKVTL